MVDHSRLHRRLHRRQLELMGRLAPHRERSLERMQEAVYPGYRFPWRVAECPALIPEELFRLDLRAIQTLLAPFLEGRFREDFLRYVPPRYRRGDGRGWFPRFLATDYQRIYDPKTKSFSWCFPELQSFPGNLLLKPLMLEAIADQLPEWAGSGLFLDPSIKDREAYRQLIEKLVIGEHDPARCIIVDLHPKEQATVVDHLLFVKQLGMRLVDLADIEFDASTAGLLYRRATVFEHGQPVERSWRDPQGCDAVLCRALPDEMDAAVARGVLDSELLTKIFRETTGRGGVDWIVHPQDFFVLAKASLVDNPAQSPPLRPVTQTLCAELESEGLSLGDGIIKPAHAAGGRGLLGFENAASHKIAREMGRRLAAAREHSDDPGEHLEELHLWQERYGADLFSRAAIPGVTLDPAVASVPIYHELRLLWSATTHANAEVELQLLCGLTRWSSEGTPANARHQTTPFTGTQGILIDRRSDETQP